MKKKISDFTFLQKGRGIKVNSLRIFENDYLGQVRTTTVNSEPYLLLRDVCRILELDNVSQVKSRLKEDGVITNEVIDNLGRTQQATFINESNFYKVVFQSRKPQAEEFTDWVTEEILPSIRRTGSYVDTSNLSPELQMFKQVLVVMANMEQGVKAVDSKVDAFNDDLQDFKKDMPLLALECDRITTAVRRTGVRCLGGKESLAYQDKSLRGKVYSDIYGQLKREFGVTTYKGIKRRQCDMAVEIVSSYRLPIALLEEVEGCNAQITIGA